MGEFSIEVDDAGFDDQVLTASKRVPVIVDVWASWCQPCRVLKPMLERLAGEYGGRFLLAKINSDENPACARRLGVRGIPAVKAFIDGELIEEFTGALPEAQVRAFIERIVPSPAAGLIAAAKAARADGELATATALLADARVADPQSAEAWLESADAGIAAADLAGAQAALDGAEPCVRMPAQATRLAALRAQLALALAGAGGDIDTLRADLAAEPESLAKRERLGNALALAGEPREAMEQFLGIVQRDRAWGGEAGRKGLLQLFNSLATQPEYDDLVREYRVKLARTLN